MFEKTIKKNKLNEEYTNAVLSGNVDKIRELFAPLEELDNLPEDMPEHEIEKITKKIEEQTPYLDYEMVTTQGIMRAAQNEDWKMVAELFNLGANLEVKIDPYDWYLIHECVVNAPDSILKPFIEYANLNVKNKKGQTPLMVAIERSKDHASDLILENGVFNLAEIDKEKNNIAHYAAKYNKNELFLKLIEKGVPLLNKNKAGETAIDLISDDVFRMSLPIELERLSSEGKNIVFKENEETVSINKELSTNTNADVTEDEVKPKVTGLSKIKKR